MTAQENGNIQFENVGYKNIRVPHAPHPSSTQQHPLRFAARTGSCTRHSTALRHAGVAQRAAARRRHLVCKRARAHEQTRKTANQTSGKVSHGRGRARSSTAQAFGVQARAHAGADKKNSKQNNWKGIAIKVGVRCLKKSALVLCMGGPNRRQLHFSVQALVFAFVVSPL